MKRRHVLGLTATGIASLAGCSSSSGDGSNAAKATTTTARPTTATSTPSSTSTETAGSDEASSQAKAAGEYPVETTSGAVAKAPVDGDTSGVTYAVMGHHDADASATLYGNWKCPFTQEFVTTDFADVVSDYVEPGKLNVRFRAIAYEGDSGFLGPDAPRATRAGLAVWEQDPDTFWKYFATVFESQPREKYDWATTEQLLTFADAAGISNRDAVRERIENEAYTDAMRQTVEDAKAAGVSTVPRLVVDGTVTAPTRSFENTRDAIERAIDEA